MIVVTGMHRSGTSLTALVLRALGADFGPAERLYAADAWNANGYLERVDVVDLNSRLITGHDRTTGWRDQVLSQVNYLRMPGRSAIAHRADEEADSIARLGAEIEPLVVKDPRFCLTLGHWNRHSPIDALVVALRHPSASVASLRRRNKLPAALGHRFWRWHMAAVLRHIDERTLVVRQDVLTGPDHDAEVERIGRWLTQVAGVEASAGPVDVIDRTLVHHTPTDDGVPLSSLHLWDSLRSARAWRG